MAVVVSGAIIDYMEPPQSSEAMFFTGENEQELRAFLADVTYQIMTDPDGVIPTLYMSVNGIKPPQNRLALRAGHFIVKSPNSVDVVMILDSVRVQTELSAL